MNDPVEGFSTQTEAEFDLQTWVAIVASLAVSTLIALAALCNI